MALADFTDHEIEPSEVDDDWIAAGWDDVWDGGTGDMWSFIGEVINDALDYLDDGGYLG